jgi:two-component system chemotaxis sensor kinase CheA
LSGDDLRRQLLETFLGELDEHVRSLNAGLLAFEAQPTAEPLAAMLRSAHSLKGASAALRLRPLEQVCHWLEDRLIIARDGLLPSPEEFVEMFAAVDAMQDAAARLAMGQELGEAPLVPWIGAAQPEPVIPDFLLEGDFDGLLAPLPQGLSEGVAPPPGWEVGAALEGRSDPQPPSAGKGPEPSREHVEARSHEPAIEASLRVPVSRLDAIYAGGGEVARVRTRYQSCLHELREMTDRVARWQIGWRAVDAWMTRARGQVSRSVALTLDDAGEQLRTLRQTLEGLNTRLLADDLQMQNALIRLQGLIAGIRMQPLGEICQGLERAVRDVARLGGKDVGFVVEGAEVEIDRSVLASLRDPLLHLVRNAVDHGIEGPDDRILNGKPPQARVAVRARIVGAQVEVTVEDDGRGLDLAAIRAKAASRGWAVPDDDREAIRLVFRSGFSTARVVTDISGRGVGLDVVKTQIEALNGNVEVESGYGRGTRFVLRCPLTLTSLRALTLRAGRHLLAFPSVSVERAMRIGSEQVVAEGGRSTLVVDDHALPIASLEAILDGSPAPPLPASIACLIVGSAPRQVVLVVDELVSEQEVTLQALGPRVGSPPHLSGATVRADGRVVLILNAASLVSAVLEEQAGRVAPPTQAPPPQRHRLLVVDDSMTVRSLEKALLEAAGYEVTAAVDGLDAWEKLQDSEVDLVVSDVEMPRESGLDLVRRIRSSRRFRAVPVVLVTAMGTEEQKAEGMEAGANAYLVKSGFDQHLLIGTIRRFL